MKRLPSLDILRGLTIFGMIIVNTPGPGGAAPMFIHSAWDGCTVADLVFPFFIFIVGASIFFAMRKSDFRLDWRVSLKILKRSALIFLVGFALNMLFSGGAPIAEVRLMAALQRIAILYCGASFIVLWFKKSSYIAIFTGVLLLGYWAIIHFTDSYVLVHGNAIAAFDAGVLGEVRMYHIGEFMFDPEGMASNMSALCNVFIGYLVARFLSRRVWWQSLALGAALTALGLVWGEWFPLNKPLWSSSFVLYTCGLATMLWAVMHYLCDVKGYVRWGYFFKVFGVNAITCYVLSELLVWLNWSTPFSLSGWLFDNVYGGVLTGWLSSLVWAMIIVMATWTVAFVLERKKIYIKL